MIINPLEGAPTPKHFLIHSNKNPSATTKHQQQIFIIDKVGDQPSSIIFADQS